VTASAGRRRLERAELIAAAVRLESIECRHRAAVLRKEAERLRIRGWRLTAKVLVSATLALITVGLAAPASAASNPVQKQPTVRGVQKVNPQVTTDQAAHLLLLRIRTCARCLVRITDGLSAPANNRNKQAGKPN
jgi:hypothetical protein